jgi:hypothetical protein
MSSRRVWLLSHCLALILMMAGAAARLRGG